MAGLTCPGCGRENSGQAMLCSRCGRDLLAEADGGLSGPGPEPAPVEGSEINGSGTEPVARVVCLEPGCGYEFREEDAECRRCGAKWPSPRTSGWRISGDGVLIGISPGEHVTLGRAGIHGDQFASRDNVSGTHLMVSVSDDGGTVSILDLHSTNGTFVNGERIESDQELETREPVDLRLASNVHLRVERA